MTDRSSSVRRNTGTGIFVAKLVVAATSIVFVMGVFELGLRLLGYQAIYEIYSNPSVLWRPHPILGWVHEASATDVYVGPRPWPIEFESKVTINSLGLRGPEVPPRSEDDHRIMFLGDSMVAGFEVEYEKTFAALAGRTLSERMGRKVRSINAGVRGYGTDQSYLYFRDYGKALEPEVVVFFYSRNDLVENRNIHRMRRLLGKAAFHLEEDGKLTLVGTPVPDYPTCSAYEVDSSGRVERVDGLFSRGLCRWQTVLFERSALFSFVTLRIPWDPVLLMKLYYLAIPGAPDEAIAKNDLAYGRKLTLALIRELRDEVERSGAKFVLTGSREQIEEDLGVAELEQLNVLVRSLAFPESPNSADYRFVHDSHYNERGHAEVVEELAPVLEALLAGAETQRVGR